MSLIIKNLSYEHSNREVLFENISFSIREGQKLGLVGNNGVGKSTLMKILNSELLPSSGEIVSSDRIYYIPQHFGQYNNLTVSQALKIDNKLKALQGITEGDASVENFAILNDDWTIEERASSALGAWGLEYISLEQSFDKLSGGEKTKTFLAGISIHEPDIVLMDEPTNHLDFFWRKHLYDMIINSRSAMLIISHDRTLLNLLSEIYELNRDGIVYYAGNYESYKSEKELMMNSLQAQLEEKQKQLRIAKKTAIETAERKQKHEARGKKNNIKKGVGKMAMDTFQDKAEKSATKLKDIHADKMNTLSDNISIIRQAIPDMNTMKVDFNTSDLHIGKILVDAKDINFSYGNENQLWSKPLSFQIKSGERIALKGENGSGKSTLLKLITNQLFPTKGNLNCSDFKYTYLDQEYSLVKNNLTVLEQVQMFNEGQFEDYEIKTILNRFLFSSDTWDKLCEKLSGGEKMKLALCCLMIGGNTPDMFILDEPTNNIDIQNVEILTSTIKDFRGTILVVSHDQYFLEQIGIDYSIELS